MLIRLQTDATEPLYRQIAAQVRRAVYGGKLKAGDKLPTGRALAASLGVNMHTVLRAYSDLRDEGLIEMRQGRGVRIVGESPLSAALIELADQLLDEAARVGLADSELIELMSERMQMRKQGQA